MAAALEIVFDPAAFAGIAWAMREMQAKAPRAIARAVNAVGNKTTLRMKAVLAHQTGLQPRIVNRALRTRHASAGSLVFRIQSRGGDIRLRYFAALETETGVSAAPKDKRQVYAGSFIKGGRFPDRADIGRGGQVFMRSGKSRLPIALVRSGLYLPQEMTDGATAAAFHDVAARDLPTQLAVELARMLGSP
jgi:hypothetical protein